MNKRITSLTLVFVMILSMLATAVPALAAPASTCTYTIEADKASAHPGDTVNFTIYMQQTGNQNTLQGELSIPSGLTYVSGDLVSGIKTTLGWDAVEWTPSTMMLTGYGSESFTGTEKVAVLQFQCKVNNDAVSQDYSVELIDVEADDELYETKYPTSVPAVVTVTAAPKPATGISLNKSTTTIYTGANETLIATVEPNDTTDTVTWTSSDTAVATVDNTGKVTAVATGTATITAKAGSKSATCVVTVTNAPCTHTNKSTVPAKDSTCTEKGWEEYKKCDNCGQLFNTSDVEIDEVPFRNLADHTGGTATCTAKAVCSVCHQPYDDYAAHSYTAATKKAEALKTAGNCRDNAVYYYSCAACGNVEHNDAHTFEGDKDANTHVGGTSTVNAIEPDHKNQHDGYTGDTKCLGCNEIIATGTSIPAGAHTPSSTWNSDGTYHWKECAVQGCDVEIDGSKAEHRPMWKYDNTSHWHVCAVCRAETDEHQEHQFNGGKTCGVCGYTKGSTIVILDPADTDKPDLENPGTGAAVSGSSIGYACAALAVVGTIYVGAKKLAKKDEE